VVLFFLQGFGRQQFLRNRLMDGFKSFLRAPILQVVTPGTIMFAIKEYIAAIRNIPEVNYDSPVV